MSPVAAGAGPALPDAEARRQAVEDVGRSLVVVAGAGTGKTATLVGRVASLVRAGTPLGGLAVITFTEAAAAELRVRLAEALSGTADAAGVQGGRGRARAEVDEAAVCTIHAFAQRVLVEHATAAGLPPGFDVLDELAERADLEERLARFTDDLFDDPSAEPMLLRGFVLGLGPAAIWDLAWSLHRHWDRLEDGGSARIEAARPGPEDWPGLDVGPVLDAIDRALSFEDLCTEEEDLLLDHLRTRLRRAQGVLAAASRDEQAALPLLVRLPAFGSGYGKAEHWGGRAAEVRAACAEAETARQELLARVRAPVLAELLARLARFTVAAAADRAADGRLTFHDLLVHTRRLLRDDPTARGALRRRYRFLLVDEFQDTDPLQVELAAWLASAVEGEDGLEGGLGRILGGARPGALFVVGDPTQSIYRFRRADIELFERVCAEVGDEAVLSANFRSVPGIVEFVNTVFPALFAAGDGQPPYRPLAAQRRALPSTLPSGTVQLTLAGISPEEPEPPWLALPPVVVLGGPVDGSLGEVRRSAGRDAAAAVRRVVTEDWPVSDPEDPEAPPRRPRWRDVAVLIPARTALGALEEAFEDAEVPYRLEGAALLWGADEVGDVLSALGAADEPSDAVSVLAALRAPGLACGDDDLVEWHAAGGSWDPRAEPPDDMDGHPVATAMALLADLHRRRWWAEPSEMVAAATALLHGYALAFARRRPRQVFQRLRWLADQSRMFDDTVGGSLHDFLRWAELQREGDGRAANIGPPEPDDDAVRVMTVHGAKGLEFPVTVVTGLERDESAGFRADAVLWRRDGGVEVGPGALLRSAGYEEMAGSEKALDRLERVRLLYVAMTRARDHLVVCLHHKLRTTSPDTSQAAALEELCRAHPLLWRRLADGTAAGTARGARAVLPARRLVAELDAGPDALRRWADDLAEWSARRAETLARWRALPVVTASALGHDAPPPAHRRRSDAPGAPRRSDPAGADTALRVGRAVHAVLAAVDLGTGLDDHGRDVAELAVFRAGSHGVPARAGEVRAMVTRALASPVVAWAAGRPHHKEMFLATALGAGDDAGVFEGFVDLLVEGDDGLVVVDYKTDGVAGATGTAEVGSRYAAQVAAYASAAEAATGTPVTRAVVVLLGADPAVEHEIAGPALEEARRRVDAEVLVLAGAGRTDRHPLD
ncbi:MAG: UvrD-helicase domain-containing protein [Acidobacteriota bacterium]|nr:UvrD-helicase domain-containing protein [Acidobacteriota bacterium]